MNKFTITKDLKPEYAFMTMVDKLIKDYGQKQHYIGYQDNKLYFKCEGYAALIRTRATHNVFEDFLGIEPGKYRRKILDMPYGSFELSKTERFSDEAMADVVQEVDSILDSRLEFCLESDKEMLYKLASITEKTCNWIKDNDLKLFSSWNTFKVFKIKNTTIIAKADPVDDGQEYYTYLIINPKGSDIKPEYHEQQSMELELIENDMPRYIENSEEETEEVLVEVIENEEKVSEEQEIIEAEELQEAIADIENEIDETEDFIMPGM